MLCVCVCVCVCVFVLYVFPLLGYVVEFHYNIILGATLATNRQDYENPLEDCQRSMC